MVAFRKSIRFKIFSVAVGLLIAMAFASIWSAWSTARVNRQLGAFSEALFPIALTIEDLRAAMLVEQAEIDRHERQVCARGFAARAARTQKLLDEARAYRAKGLEISLLDRNRLKFAELGPLLDNIDDSHHRLIAQVNTLCAPGRDAEEGRTIELLARGRASDIAHTLDRLNDDLAVFVRDSFRQVEANEQRALYANLILVLTAALVGLYLAFLISRGLTRPIHMLRDGALAVQSGKLDGEVAVTTSDEIGDVTRAFNAMLADLRAKEEIKATFGQYVDPRIVSSLIGEDAARSVAGEKQRVTIFFSDLVGFTPIADRLTPGGLVTVMNAYFTEMSASIRARHGIIDKYIGDAVMAFWVAPFVSPDTQAIEACRAALAQFERLEAFRAQLPDLMGLRRDLPPMDIRVGLSTGDAIVGSIGSDVAKSFTVMGDVVNAGSRLEGANRYYGTRILIDEETRRLAGDAIEVRAIDRIVLKGRSEAHAIYELRAMRGGDDAGSAALIECYDAAYAAYARGDWAGARKGFGECLRLNPEDGPAAAMAARVDRMAAVPPPSWDGIWRFDEK